jgi:hypothetical protein
MIAVGVTTSCSMLQHVLADSPAITAAQLQLGYWRGQNVMARYSALKKALNARRGTGKIPGGLALYETGAWDESVTYFEAVAKKRPKWVDANTIGVSVCV